MCGRNILLLRKEVTSHTNNEDKYRFLPLSEGNVGQHHTNQSSVTLLSWETTNRLSGMNYLLNHSYLRTFRNSENFVQCSIHNRYPTVIYWLHTCIDKQKHLKCRLQATFGNSLMNFKICCTKSVTTWSFLECDSTAVHSWIILVSQKDTICGKTKATNTLKAAQHFKVFIVVATVYRCQKVVTIYQLDH